MCNPSIMLRTLPILALVLLNGCARNPPLVVRVVETGGVCTVNLNGEALTLEQIYLARLQRVEKVHGRRIIVDADGNIAYRCFGGAVFNLQRAGFQVVDARVNGASLPSR